MEINRVIAQHSIKPPKPGLK